MAEPTRRGRRDLLPSTVLTLVWRLVVSAVALGVAVVAGVVATAAFSGQPDNTVASNIEIVIVAAVVGLMALVAVVTVWRRS